MNDLESALEQAAERLAEDEQWRSNLIDAEAKVLLDWAMQQLTTYAARLANQVDEEQTQDQFKAEVRRVRQTLKSINGLLEADRIPEPSAACAALDWPVPADPIEPFPDRLALLHWLLA